MKISITNVYLFMAAAALAGCGSGGGAHKAVPGPDSTRAAGAGGVGFDQVQGIFQMRCIECHPGKGSPDNWTVYAAAKAKAAQIKDWVVVKRQMPDPSGSAQALAITEAERAKIGAWVDSGAPETSSAAPAGGAASATAGAPKAAEGGPAQACIGCHGDIGSGSKPGDKWTPKIAGQNARYLQIQLMRFFKEDRVDYAGQMLTQARNLETPERMAQVAAYFDRPGGLAPDDSPKLSKEENQLFARGMKVATERRCLDCHMSASHGGQPQASVAPRLAGQSKDYLEAQLREFRNGLRKFDEMNMYVSGMSDADFTALAMFFSASREPPAPAPR